MNGYRINSIDSLCNFIMNKKPNADGINQIMWHLGIKAIFIEDLTPEQYCIQVKDYWQKWQHTKERPIFIGLTLD